MINTMRRTKTGFHPWQHQNDPVVELQAAGPGTWLGGSPGKRDIPAGAILCVIEKWHVELYSQYDGNRRVRKGYRVLGPNGGVYFMTYSMLKKWTEVP